MPCGAKVLLTAVLDLESQTTFVLAHHCPQTTPSAQSPDNITVYSAILETNQDMGITTAKYHTILDETHEFTQTERFGVIDRHPQTIADRIGGVTGSSIFVSPGTWNSWRLRVLSWRRLNH
ncbi:hypothetical protein DFH09DRAFT_1190384 [Mycena vulgaris]|nr:hypothetical protein DFH09DRAFT_1190384 [Mycena vulgaris]